MRGRPAAPSAGREAGGFFNRKRLEGLLVGGLAAFAALIAWHSGAHRPRKQERVRRTKPGKKWKQALALFESMGDDPASRLYAEGCRALTREPCGDGDSIWNLENK